MALFPKATFEVLVPDGRIAIGGVTRGIVVLDTARDIPRVSELVVELVSIARFRYPAVWDRVLFTAKARVTQPPVLAKGTHRIPFEIETPSWLPPTFFDELTDVEHRVDVRLDVAWGLDPSTRLQPPVVLRPREGHREPVRLRLPPAFHARARIELVVDSRVVRQGEPVLGHVELLQGTIEPYPGITLLLMRNVATGSETSWWSNDASVLVSAAALAAGQPVAFEIPADAVSRPSFRTGFVDNAVYLGVMLQNDFASFLVRAHRVALEVLPRGSIIHDDLGGASVLRGRAAQVAAATGLREGDGSCLAEGEPAGLTLRIHETTAATGRELEVSIGYPDLGLGLELRELSPLHAALARATLPAFPRHQPVAKRDDLPPSFFADLFRDVPPEGQPSLSDYQLGIRFGLVDGSAEHLLDRTRWAIAHAHRVAAVIDTLPFPTPVPAAAADAWRACARSTRALLVPSAPTLSGLPFHRLTADQQDRAFTATLTTVWKDGAPRDRVFLYLGEARLPESAIGPLENHAFPDGLAALRAVFSAAHVTSSGEVLTLERSAWSSDPATLLPVLEAVIDWIMRERGELRNTSAYR
ncbi:MAG: Arrestin (or S-antigen), N-terminal domain [Labilithrix sp.]|nr:Arrestin (or S-antigen), N-terminal domain [Labilithrix sp.]